MPAHVTPLPAPSGEHATCAWCREQFATVVQLIDHVDDLHVSDPPTHHRDADHAA